MISSILIINQKGEILINRAYKGDVSRAEAVLFCQKVVAAKEANEKPVQSIGLCHYIHITIADVIIVGTTKYNTNVTLVLRVLYKLAEILKGSRRGR